MKLEFLPKIKLLSFLWLLLWNLGSLEANPLFRPRNAVELGEMKMRKAFLVPGEVVWADYALLREDFMTLRDLSDSEIDSLLIAQFCYLTDLQRNLEDILYVYSEPVIPRPDKLVFVPKTYGRASVATFTQSGPVSISGGRP